MTLKGRTWIARTPRIWIVPVSALIWLLGPVSGARAALLTFAQVSESSTNTNANIFAYLNDAGVEAELGTDIGGVFGAPGAANFTYLSLPGLPADLQGVQACTISMTASTTDTTTPEGAVQDEQIFNGSGTFSDTLSITRDTPAAEGNGARTNLLTLTFSGPLEGRIGGSTPSLSGNTSLGDTVTYTSDFVTFAESTQQDFEMAFSSWTPALALAGDGNFTAATAAGAGTFDFSAGSVIVPEPTQMPWVVLGLGLALTRVRRRAGSRIPMVSTVM